MDRSRLDFATKYGQKYEASSTASCIPKQTLSFEERTPFDGTSDSASARTWRGCVSVKTWRKLVNKEYNKTTVQHSKINEQKARQREAFDKHGSYKPNPLPVESRDSAGGFWQKNSQTSLGGSHTSQTKYRGHLLSYPSGTRHVLRFPSKI